MPYVDVAPGVRMAYEDRGTGRPIVFVHGWGGSGDVWDYQVLDLADQFRVITVDLRGHGVSDKPWGDYGYATFCADLATLMRELSLEDVTLVGWSMGGHIGLKFVQTIGAPVARLVLTGSGPAFCRPPTRRTAVPRTAPRRCATPCASAGWRRSRACTARTFTVPISPRGATG